MSGLAFDMRFPYLSGNIVKTKSGYSLQTSLYVRGEFHVRYQLLYSYLASDMKSTHRKACAHMMGKFPVKCQLS